MRNRSLTKDEVAAFWRQQQQHGTPAPEPNAGSPRAETLVPVAARRQLEVTRSLPPLSAGRGGGTRSNDDHLTCCSAYGYGAGGLQQFVSTGSEPPSSPGTENAAAVDNNSGAMTRGWWTRSSSAFLNEPPPPTSSREEEVLLGRPPHRRSFACGDHFNAARIVTGSA